ncbi:MAG TPA: Fe-S protein assembly co-chaperone HscB [Abditibacteriaceae bacterium]|jgi:molecular chaperone HscB
MIHDLHFQPDGTLRATSTLDHFEFFGLPRALRLDATQLEADYFALSRRFHPDFFVSQDAEQQILALEKTSTLNNAYRTLKDPIDRAEYLVELETGVVFGESGEARQVPNELLMEVMEIREQIMDFQMADEDEREGLRAELEKARGWVCEKLEAADADVEKLASGWDDVTAQVENDRARAYLVGELKNVLSQRRYFSGLARDIDKIL